jgi:hypothetical protein
MGTQEPVASTRCATSKAFAIPIVRLVPGSRSVVIVLTLVTNCTNDDGAVIDYFK